MSVTSTTDIQYRRFSGHLDPRLPEGQWYASARVNADASGGEATCSLRFSRAGEPLSSKLYTLEALSLFSNDGNTRTIELRMSNMSGPTNEVLEHRYTVVADTTTNPARNAVRAREVTFLPIFLGAQRTTASQCLLSAIQTNTNGVEYFFQAAGYWWGARSVLADGGPQRPPGSIYGN
jgi:hypothetical protein